jgi:uncharacterized protein YjbJ (UPF0337 family)
MFEPLNGNELLAAPSRTSFQGVRVGAGLKSTMPFQHIRGNPPKRPKAGIKSSARDEIEGAARTISGIVKEETGKTLENPELQAEGNAEQFVGNAQRSIGKIKKLLGG